MASGSGALLAGRYALIVANGVGHRAVMVSAVVSGANVVCRMRVVVSVSGLQRPVDGDAVAPGGMDRL